MPPIICDPANCPTGKRVDEALESIGGLRQDLTGARQDYKKTHEEYKETQKALTETNNVLIKQTTKLEGVSFRMETDRNERREEVKELFSKVEVINVGLASKADKKIETILASKADKESVFTRSTIGIMLTCMSLMFGGIMIAIAILEYGKQ
jgi:predicted  nucleic acid-binding Zn-ribbon protein